MAAKISEMLEGSSSTIAGHVLAPMESRLSHYLSSLATMHAACWLPW